jgi:hypothetical protein
LEQGFHGCDAGVDNTECRDVVGLENGLDGMEDLCDPCGDEVAGCLDEFFDVEGE